VIEMSTLTIKMIRPGYPILQTKYVKVYVDIRNEEIRELESRGFGIVSIEVD